MYDYSSYNDYGKSMYDPKKDQWGYPEFVYNFLIKGH